MIPDIAVIISAYAIARLLCEYVLTGDKLQPLRFVIGIGAAGVIVLFMASVVATAGALDLSGL
jgi:hypothetical protein